MADYLESAAQALDDALEMDSSAHQARLLAVADTHARIAAAETLRAILGVLIAALAPDPTEGVR